MIPAIPDRRELLELYRVAIDEYRFEVRLNWDRMQYYVVVNSGIVAVGTSLIAKADTFGVVALSGTMFIIGFVMTIIGIFAIHRGRDYYQQTIYK